jgi:hypothetical protein
MVPHCLTMWQSLPMQPMSESFHGATTVVEVPAEAAFAYLSDGLKQSDWALGSWNRERIGEQLFRGTSLFDGSETYVRISADPTWLIVDYAVGPTLEQMPRVNSARIVPGPELGYSEGSCVVTLMKWRTPGQTDEQWRRGCVTFDTEIHMIRGRLELGF